MPEAHTLPMVGERVDDRIKSQGIQQAKPPAGVGARHPVERIQLTHLRRGEEQHMMLAGRVHGAHAPLRMKMERELLSQFQRLPGLPSSMVGLETVLDMDDTIEFEDIMNLEENAAMSRSTGPNRSLHDVMEHRLNMRF